MVQIERICIDLVLALKRGKLTEEMLEDSKQKIFIRAMEIVHGKDIWNKINDIIVKI